MTSPAPAPTLNSLAQDAPIGVTILGATGSIGINTLDVLARHPDKFRVTALTAHRGVERMAAQCRQWEPRFAVMADPASAEALATELRDAGLTTEVLAGPEALARVAAHAETDYVMAAIVGGAGLLPTLAAAQAGKRVLLANKEALVMSGMLMMTAVREHGAELVPIDSEHNAIFQCMPDDFERGLASVGVEQILLTASGGPFRQTPVEQLQQVTPAQACAHPNWSMGRKISVDSATMMNKGLEVIEACWLFNTAVEHIQVVLHPQSVIHSMVAYSDGSVLAQLGNPDMRTPIAHALGWPERLAAGVQRLDLFAVARLDFEPPDWQRFPCLRLAYEAMATAGTATVGLNAANEVAVAAFLDEGLGFTAIPAVIEEVLGRMPIQQPVDIDTVLAADSQARELAAQAVARQRSRVTTA